MPAVRYINNAVTDGEIARLERIFQQAPKEGKYGRFMALRHYRNLRRWRNQGYHFHYLSGAKEYFCTCGLALMKEGKGAPAIRIPLLVADRVIEEFKPDDLQSYLGHRNLPSGRGLTAAILTKFRWSETDGDYRWGAFCQVCGEVVREELNDSASEFVAAHNRRCKRRLKLLLGQ